MDDLLKDKFLSFEGDIPMSDWFAIEEKLDKKRRFAWIWWAALPLLIIAGLGFYSLFIDKQEDTLTKNSITQKTKSKQEVTFNENKKSDIVNSTPLFADKKVKRTDLKSQKPISKTNFIPEIEITETKTVSEFIFESITLSGKPLSELWTYKYITPAVEKIKDLEPVSKKTRKPGILSFEFGVNLAPAMGLDAIKENKNNWINRHYFSSIEGSSSLGSGFNNGIHAQMNIGNHWYIRQGIYSSTYSVYNNYNYTIDSFPTVTVGTGIDKGPYRPLNPNEIEHIQYSGKASVKYLSLPLFVGNRFNFNKKIGLETKIGVNLSRLLSAQGKTVNPTYLSLEDINSNNTIKKWNTGLTISTGLFYKPNNKFIFTAEPTFSTLLGSARNKDYPVKTRYYNYGFNLNVNYIFGRK